MHRLTIRRIAIFMAVAAALARSAAPLSAAGSGHWEVLKKIPCSALRLAGGGMPDADGLVGDNRGGYRSPAFQRGAARVLLLGAVCGDRALIDEAFRAVDVVFARQDAAGHFGGDKTASGVAFWLCELNAALLVLRESEYAARYAARLDELVPKIRTAASWLASPNQQERLKEVDAPAPNRLFFDALAYGLSGLLCGDERLIRTGRLFIDLGVSLYRPEDGVFLEKGGPDSSYQAVAAWLLQIWVLYFPEGGLEAIADRAASWVVGRIESDGTVDVTGNTRTGLGQETWQGRVKDVNYPEVLRCLLYYSARRGDRSAIEAAGRLMSWMRKRK